MPALSGKSKPVVALPVVWRCLVTSSSAWSTCLAQVLRGAFISPEIRIMQPYTAGLGANPVDSVDSVFWNEAFVFCVN